MRRACWIRRNYEGKIKRNKKVENRDGRRIEEAMETKSRRISKEESVEGEYLIYLFTAIGLSPGGSGYFTCKQNMKSVTTKFKSGGLHEKHVVATWIVGDRLSIYL